MNRTVSMVYRYRDGQVPHPAPDAGQAGPLRAARAAAAPTIDAALHAGDFRTAVEAVVRVAAEGNRYLERVRPWEQALGSPDQSGPQLDAVLGELVATGRELADHLTPFLPSAAVRLAAQCGGDGPRVGEPVPAFPRLTLGSKD